MTTKSQRPKRDDVLSSLNKTMDTLNRAKEVASVIPAKAVFASANVLFTVITVGFLPVHIGRLLARKGLMVNIGW
jgi:hypothetical protein